MCWAFEIRSQKHATSVDKCKFSGEAALKKRVYPIELLTGLLPVLLGLQLVFWIVELPSALHGFADFRQLYVTGYMVSHGASARIYDYSSQLDLQNRMVSRATLAFPFIRPAYQAVLFAPFSLMPYRSAYVAWFCINLVCAITAYLFIRRFVPKFDWPPIAPILFFCFAPFSIALIQGQDSILWLLLFVLAMLEMKAGREKRAGILMALGLFKLQLAVPLLIVFMIWKRWKFVQAFVSTGLAFAVVSLVLIGRSGVSDLVHLRFLSQWGLAANVDYGMMANAHALLVGILGQSTTASVLGAALSVAILIVASVKAQSRELTVAVVIASVCSYYLYPHDWLPLIIPLLLAIGSRRFLAWSATVTFLAMAGEPLFWRYAWLVSVPMIVFCLTLIKQGSQTDASGRLA